MTFSVDLSDADQYATQEIGARFGAKACYGLFKAKAKAKAKASGRGAG